MRASARHSALRRAFTLVEIMVAMAIFALVIAAIYSTWSLILRGTKVGLEAAAEVQRRRMTAQIISESLHSVRSFESDLKDYWFDIGDDERPLSFVAKLPDSFPRSGRFGSFDVRRLMFSLEPGEDGGRDLVLRQWPMLMDIDEVERDNPLILAHDVRQFLREVWDPKKEEWVDEWKTTNAIPPLVKITLTFEQRDRRNAKDQSPIIRVIDLPSKTVPGIWQGVGGRAPGAPGAPGGAPSIPIPNPAGVNPRPAPGGFRPQ